jgi:hypothetical protein
LASAASSSDGSSTMQQNQFTMQTVTWIRGDFLHHLTLSDTWRNNTF